MLPELQYLGELIPEEYRTKIHAIYYAVQMDYNDVQEFCMHNIRLRYNNSDSSFGAFNLMFKYKLKRQMELFFYECDTNDILLHKHYLSAIMEKHSSVLYFYNPGNDELCTVQIDDLYSKDYVFNLSTLYGTELLIGMYFSTLMSNIYDFNTFFDMDYFMKYLDFKENE